MIKLCNVINFNSKTHVVLAMFEDIQIQFVTDRDIVSGSVYIEKVKDSFEIVDKNGNTQSLKGEKKNAKKVEEEIIVD